MDAYVICVCQGNYQPMVLGPFDTREEATAWGNEYDWQWERGVKWWVTAITPQRIWERPYRPGPVRFKEQGQ